MSWTVRRVRRPGARLLEIWNLEVSGRPLFQWAGAERARAMRGRPDGEAARAIAAVLRVALERIRPELGFERVHVTGGLSELAGFDAAVAEWPWPVERGDGRFACERGGIALLREAGRAEGVVLDVGQTAVKVSSWRGGGIARTLRERDDELAPSTLIASALAVGAEGVREKATVVALPCLVDDAGVPGPCSYGWAGDGDLVPRALREADARLGASHPWRGAAGEAILLNDTELAAAGVRRGARTLVVTLGFAPGAVLLE